MVRGSLDRFSILTLLCERSIVACRSHLDNSDLYGCALVDNWFSASPGGNLMVMRCKRHVFVLSLGWLLISSSAAAQVSTFDLSGTVADASGALLTGVTVTLQNTQTGLTRQATTDDKGRYSFFALPVVGEWTRQGRTAGLPHRGTDRSRLPGQQQADDQLRPERGLAE